MIAKKLKKLKDNKSPGVEMIPPKLLKEIVEQINTPLAIFFNLSLEEGIVPSEWKEANITPLFKKGSRKKPENYRPVSLTSVVCKLLETLIRYHMVEFLVKHKLMNTSQHGHLLSVAVNNASHRPTLLKHMTSTNGDNSCSWSNVTAVLTVLFKTRPIHQQRRCREEQGWVGQRDMEEPLVGYPISTRFLT